ncbi:MAG TPA: hypothetical protein DCF33_01730 [Saprospirales bacterium]|nr:hypothetical protein [Saprospirales bacterium]
MKKSNFHITLSLVIWWAFACATSFAQTNVNMTNNGITPGSPYTIAPPGTCFFNFFDNGGPNLNYNNNANAEVTFTPSNPATHRIQVSFTSFGLEQNWDALYIYNGTAINPANKINGPQGPTNSGFPGGNWQSISPGTITANTGIAAVGANAAEALTFHFLSDNAITTPGWTAIVRQVPILNCPMTAPVNQTVNTGPGSNNCFVNVTTALPTFPGGCNAGYQLQYRINGGAPTVVLTPINTVITAPVGNNVVTWELVDPCGGGVISAAIQIINVIDNTPPTITHPSNTTITLGSGQCDFSNYNYQVNCSDNCAAGTNGQVNHPIDFAPANLGNAGIMFDVTNLGSTPLTITQFGPSLDVGTFTMEVYYTQANGSFNGVQNNPAAWTLAGSALVTSISSASGTPVPGFGITIPAGETRGIYLTSTTGAPLNYTDAVRQVNDGTLRVSSNPGVGKTFPFGVSTPNRAYNGYVNYSTPNGGVAVQVAPFPPAVLEQGNTYTYTFKCTDASGNMTTASWNVTIVDFPTPISTITCNDVIILALGPDCRDTLLADQILEGGPFRCFDYYPVQVDKTLPYGNGPWVPAVFDCNDVGKTYRFRVFDDLDEDGIMDNNENRCFGDVKIEDNLPPALDCEPTPITIPFNFPLTPLFAQDATLELPFRSQGLPVNVTDGQIREFQIPVNLPMGAIVDDVDLRVKIGGDVFFADMNIQVESPQGTVVTLWDGAQACAGSLFVRFDDEGIFVPVCDSYTTDKNAQIPFGLGVLSSFDGEQVNGIWRVRIADQNAGGDVSSIQIADLHIRMTGIFGAGLPNGIDPDDVILNGNQSYVVPKATSMVANLDFCSDVTLTYLDQSQNQNCASGLTSIISRTWTAKDATGNTATCIQTLHLLRPTLNDVNFPPDYDGIEEQTFTCKIGVYPTPEWIEDQGLQGFPWVFGLPDGGAIFWEHHDTPVWSCDGSYSISRKWTVVDPCTGVIKEHIQLIQVLDEEGPVFITPIPDQLESTDPYDCCASMILPEVLLMDSCSQVNKISALIYPIDPVTGLLGNPLGVNGGLFNFPGNLLNNPDTLASFGAIPCIPVGDHLVIYIAEDDCGNTSSISFNLTIQDFEPPTAACDETTIVGIGKDNPFDCYEANFANCEFGGITWVRATTFDDGSFDLCSDIKFTIRRALPYSDCITSLDDSPCAGNPLGLSEFDLAIAESDSIKFYCCEVGSEVKVILRVYQVNPDGTISTLPDGTQIYNECEVMVKVQDNLKPVCETPFNVTVNCENFDPSLWTYGKPNVYDNCCLDVNYEYQGQKGLSHSVSYTQFDSVCNKGTITRTFRVYDCHGQSTQCTQRIFVNYEQDYFIKFPNDVVITTCDGSGMYGEPQFFGEDCELLGVSYQDQVYTVVPDACFKIERTWRIINWCTYNPGAGCTVVPNPTPHPNSSHASNLPGPIVSPVGTLAPWAPTVVKITPNDPSATNYSTYWNQNANCYEYKQIIKIIDQQAPTMTCPASPVEFCDLTTNDPNLWNESYWWEAEIQSNNMNEAPVDLTISVTDLCSGSNLSIRYLLFLDLDNNGSMETAVSSVNAPAPGTVNYDNANTPNFSGGTPRIFDERAVNPNQKYRFGLQTTVNGTSLTASVRWNTTVAPGLYSLPELPYGKHKIKWIASDGCGNESVCEYEFIIKDCEAPTLVCMNGLTGNLTQTGVISLFASDFLLDADDNSTPDDFLVFGIRKCGQGVGFPLDANNNPQISISFDCNELGPQCVELWGLDAYGNADRCDTYMIIQDNNSNCGNGSATVAGALKTEMNEGLEETDVELAGPTFNLFDMTDQAGQFSFLHAVPMHMNYTVTPTKDDNPLNGVTTYDLVLISKHILGLEPLNSPYKMIAADANRSGSITTFDIVELRKLILGIYTELPANESWRFVDKSFVFPNVANPFQTNFPEEKSVLDIQANAMDDDFVAIKVGDVNASAIANSLMTVEERSTGALLFDVEDRVVKAGEVFELKFKASEKVSGYQFTLQFNDLDLVDVVPGPGMKADHFGTFAAENAVTTSFDGPTVGEFSLRFKARKSGEVSKMIGVSSRITKAESYQIDTDGKNAQRLDVALRFNGKDGSTISGVGFELYQNQPNPFVNRTLIGFHLPEAAAATLSIFDQSGRLVYSQKGDFPKGYNSIPLDRALINSNGLLYYKLETANNSATRTMIQVK